MSTQPTDLPLVAVVGRPNVGKSTLFNRIVGRREAIVEEKPGVTRDRKEVVAEWQAREFRLVDTGGWMPGGDSLDEKVSKQSEKAILEADVVLFVVDVTVGITEEDSRVAQILRRNGRPVLLVANKVDDTNRESAIWDLLGLGVGNPFPVSALHGRGTGDLLESLMLEFPPEPEVVVDEDEAEADKIFSVSIVGRPNVGKSTLFNRLIGDERSVVHDMPGTTRDAVDTVVETEDGPIRFVDTAGMRRRSKVDESTEYYSLVRALQAIDRSDVAMLVIDATVGVTAQDQRLAERIDAAGCPVVVLLNKWELLDAEARDDVGLPNQSASAFHWGVTCPEDQCALRQRGAPTAPCTRRNDRGLSPSSSNSKGQSGSARCTSRSTGSARCEGSVRDAGSDGSADVHAVREQRDPTFLSPLPRALPSRSVRYGRNPNQDASAEAGLTQCRGARNVPSFGTRIHCRPMGRARRVVE